MYAASWRNNNNNNPEPNYGAPRGEEGADIQGQITGHGAAAAAAAAVASARAGNIGESCVTAGLSKSSSLAPAISTGDRN